MKDVVFSDDDKKELKKFLVKALTVWLIVLTIMFYIDGKIDEIYLKESVRAKVICKYENTLPFRFNLTDYEYFTSSNESSSSSSSSSKELSS